MFYILFFIPSLRNGVYNLLSNNISILDKPYFKCSVATCGKWLQYWTVRLPVVVG